MVISGAEYKNITVLYKCRPLPIISKYRSRQAPHNLPCLYRNIYKNIGIIRLVTFLRRKNPLNLRALSLSRVRGEVVKKRRNGADMFTAKMFKRRAPNPTLGRRPTPRPRRNRKNPGFKCQMFRHLGTLPPSLAIRCGYSHWRSFPPLLSPRNWSFRGHPPGHRPRWWFGSTHYHSF